MEDVMIHAINDQQTNKQTNKQRPAMANRYRPLPSDPGDKEFKPDQREGLLTCKQLEF
jgi:hypothetical protein